MKRFGIVLLTVAAMLQAMPALSAGNVWYVSRTSGSNANDGSKERPFKNIQKAVDVASQGDVIRVAEGNYYGLLNCGNIKSTREYPLSAATLPTFPKEMSWCTGPMSSQAPPRTVRPKGRALSRSTSDRPVRS